MSGLIEYLKGPELVVKVQEFFGIEYLHCRENGKIDSSDAYCGGVGSSLRTRTKLRDGNKQNGDLTNLDEDSSSSSSGGNDSDKCQGGADKETVMPYRITNKFWYYLFLIGTELGDEIFYATFIPFWFWNIDSAVGRRVIMVWSAVMYVGQSLKDVIRWPRPGFPVSRLQKKWALEYGMPSTHAMVSVAIPFSVLIYTHDRYIYSLPAGLAFATIWCAVICFSRVYLGMHSVLVTLVVHQRSSWDAEVKEQ
ncbi:sphingosine-1-phosphate phosphatase 2-like [Armigeres subalbatus]|uniref:sphingosine-1-phosphate phosphatase 2-like n=1 Tax=Armigeres subalbatus TaxID=124917 RepID=UPI002ED49E97